MAHPESFDAVGPVDVPKPKPETRADRMHSLEKKLNRRLSAWEQCAGQVVESSKDGVTVRELRLSGRKIIPAKNVAGIEDVPLGTLIAVQRRRGSTDTFSVIQTLGEKGTFDAEAVALAYRFDTSPIFNPDVQKEAKVWEERGEDAIADELKKKEIVELPTSLDAWKALTERYNVDTQRINFRPALTATIDPETAKDFDDAISYRKLEGGLIEIGVHIADVTHFLPLGAGPDPKNPQQGYHTRMSAWFRQFTGYYPGKDKTCPMLPKILSEQLCSLEQGKERLAMSTVFIIDPTQDNKVVHTFVGKSAIKSDKRHTYESAQKLFHTPKEQLGADADVEQREMLHEMTKIGRTFRKARKDRGAISFTSRGEADIHINDDGSVRVGTKSSQEMNKVIEDLMVATNEECARRITKHSVITKGALPTLLRRHDPPSVGDMLSAAEQIGAHAVMEFVHEREHLDPHEKVTVDGEEKPFVIAVLDLLEEYVRADPLTPEARKRYFDDAYTGRNAFTVRKPDGSLDKAATIKKVEAHLDGLKAVHRDTATSAFRGLMQKAYMSTDEGVHIGLRAREYSWFTSPIRRYADIAATELLVESLRKTPKLALLNEGTVAEYQFTADKANFQEWQIDYGEKQILRMFGADLLSSQVGKEITCYVSDVFYEEEDVWRTDRKSGKREKKKVKTIDSLQIAVPAPVGDYRFIYKIKYRDLFSKPSSDVDQVLRMRGHEFPFTLTGVNVAQGKISLTLVENDATREVLVRSQESGKQYISEEMAEELQTVFRENLTALAEKYGATLWQNAALKKRYTTLRQAVRRYSSTTWKSTVERNIQQFEKLAEDLSKAPVVVAIEKVQTLQYTPEERVSEILSMPPEMITGDLIEKLGRKELALLEQWLSEHLQN